MFKQYQKLMRMAYKMTGEGRNALDPTVRSIFRKAAKIYKNLTEEEQAMADWADWEYC